LDGDVSYSYSPDSQKLDGKDWIDLGEHPVVALDRNSTPWAAFQKENGIWCAFRDCNGMWQSRPVFQGDSSHISGPPSMVMPNTVASLPPYAYVAFPVYDLLLGSSQVWLAKIDSGQARLQMVAATPGSLADSFVSIASTPGDLIHLAWQRAQNVVYTSAFAPPNWWSDYSFMVPQQVSIGPAKHPSIEAFGDMVQTAWQGQLTAQVVMATRHLWDPVFGAPLALSELGVVADFPVTSRGGTAAWHQRTLNGAWEVWASVGATRFNLSASPDSNSTYPSLDALVGLDSTGSPQTQALYSAWTEQVAPDSISELRFVKHDLTGMDAKRQVDPSHTVECGRPEPSLYCRYRTGYRETRGVAFDFATDSVSYELAYLDPVYAYLAEIVVMHDGPGQFEEAVRVRGRELARVRFGSEKPETLRVIIPKSLYQGGNSLPLSLVRVNGSYASLAGLRLYAFERTISRDGGVMASLSPGRAEPFTLECGPSPAHGAVRIRWQVPAASRVCLSIYDPSGRLVRTLTDKATAGDMHVTSWDGLDARGRHVAGGIYFCTLDNGAKRISRKLVLTE
jgi:hypothetical protein